MTNYKLPFNPVTLFGADSHVATCSMEESIAQHIMLLITTKHGENRFDDSYGNAVWDIEFENATSEGEWDRTFRTSLTKAIATHEPRISNPEITVRVNYLEQVHGEKKFTEIKKKASIHIKAELTESKEPFQFATEIFLSPLSVE